MGSEALFVMCWKFSLNFVFKSLILWGCEFCWCRVGGDSALAGCGVGDGGCGVVMSFGVRANLWGGVYRGTQTSFTLILILVGTLA